MEIMAKNKDDAWKKAEAIFGCSFQFSVNEDGCKIYIPSDKNGYVKGFVNEYEDELEIVFPNGDSFEIVFNVEQDKNELEEVIRDLQESNRTLMDKNYELKAQINEFKRTEEQNKTLRRMLSTYSKVAVDVLKCIDSIVEFKAFLEKVKNLSNHIGMED